MDTNKDKIANITDLIAATDRGTLSPAELAAIMGVGHRTIYPTRVAAVYR